MPLPLTRGLLSTRFTADAARASSFSRDEEMRKTLRGHCGTSVIPRYVRGSLLLLPKAERGSPGRWTDHSTSSCDGGETRLVDEEGERGRKKAEEKERRAEGACVCLCVSVSVFVCLWAQKGTVSEDGSSNTHLKNWVGDCHRTCKTCHPKLEQQTRLRGKQKHAQQTNKRTNEQTNKRTNTHTHTLRLSPSVSLCLPLSPLSVCLSLAV